MKPPNTQLKLGTCHTFLKPHCVIGDFPPSIADLTMQTFSGLNAERMALYRLMKASTELVDDKTVTHVSLSVSLALS